MRRRISWLVVITTSSIVVSFVIPLCLLVRVLAEDRAMAQADQEARSVAILVAGLSNDTTLDTLVSGIDGRGAAMTQVLTSAGRQVGGGPRMLGDPEVARALDGEAFSVVGEGGQVLIPVVLGDGTAVVRSLVSADELHRGVLAAWAAIIGLGLALMALALAVALRLSSRISEPLRQVAGTAHRLREGDLDARAEIRGTQETQELARALNGLAERTGELLASERGAVADLSHRLRTPVTALRLDAEAVSDQRLADRLQSHITVLQRTIDAIVREARRPVRTELAASCDAVETVRSRVLFWEPLAAEQGRAFDLRLPLLADGTPRVGLVVGLAADDLGDLVDVVIDNVFAHTPEGAGLRVEVAVTDTGSGLVLGIEDDGPGFGTVAASGDRVGSSGLGLDIAARTAAGAGGSLRTGTGAHGGARVQVALPLLAR